MGPNSRRTKKFRYLIKTRLFRGNQINIITNNKDEYFFEDDLINLQYSLGKYFMEHYGAPSKIIAEKAASEEINFMSDLCKDHELGSLLSVSREWSEEGIKEKFRNLPKADSCAEQKIWTVVDED